MLEQELAKVGLGQAIDPARMAEVSGAMILCNGDY